MNIGEVLLYKYPELTPNEDYSVLFDGEKEVIQEWNASVPQPTEADLQTAFEEYQLAPKRLTEIEQLQKDQAELMFTLMMKGVL